MNTKKWLLVLTFTLVICGALFYLLQDIWNQILMTMPPTEQPVAINAALSMFLISLVATYLTFDGDIVPFCSLTSAGAFILSVGLLLFRSNLMPTTVWLLFITLSLFSVFYVVIVVQNLKDEGLNSTTTVVSVIIYYIILAGHIYFCPFV